MASQLSSVQRSKATLESELEKLAGQSDFTSELSKVKRQYEVRISQLENTIQDSEIAKFTATQIRQRLDQQHAELRQLITTIGVEDNSFRTRLLQALKDVDDANEHDFWSRLAHRNGDNEVRTLANLPPSSAPSSNGLQSTNDHGVLRNRTEVDPQLKPLNQQLQALELQMLSSDRIRRHLEASLQDAMSGLEASDGSKESINAYRAQLARENARLAELLEEEATARHTAESAQIGGAQSMWGKYQAIITEERQNYAKLEESRKALVRYYCFGMGNRS